MMTTKNQIENFCAVYEKERTAGKIQSLQDVLTSYSEKEGKFLAEQGDTFRYYSLLKIFEFPFFEALYEAGMNGDMGDIHNILMQHTRQKDLLHMCLESGCDHSCSYTYAIQSMACNDFETVGKLLPEELGMAKNGYGIAVMCTNLIMAIWYQNETFRAHCVQKLPKVLAMKTTGKYKAIVACLAAIMDQDVEKINTCLSLLCQDTQKVRDIFDENALSKCFCLNAHGLFNFARRVLPEELKSQLVMPEHFSFWDMLTLWQIDNLNVNLNVKWEPYVRYTGKLRFLDAIIQSIPTAKQIIRDKKQFEDCEAIQQELKALILAYV